MSDDAPRPDMDSDILVAELLSFPAESRPDKLRAVGQPELVLLALIEEAERLLLVEVERAAKACECLVEISDLMGHGLARCRARRVQAQALSQIGHFEESLAVSRMAEVIAEQIDEPLEGVRVRVGSLHALACLGRYDEAIKAGEAAWELLATAGEWKLAARADMNLGAVYDMRDEPERALLHYDRARSCLFDDPAQTANVEANRAVALIGLDRFLEAEAAFRAALASFEESGSRWGVAVAEGNLAYLATRRGQLDQALHHYERARRLFEEDGSSADLTRLLAEQSDAVALLGMPADAVETYERVLPHLEARGLAADVALAQMGLGRALLQLGRIASAEEVLEAAATACDALGTPVIGARIDLLRAEATALDGRADEARMLLLDALELLKTRPAERVAALYLLAKLAHDTGDVASAETALELAVPIAEHLGLGPVLGDLLHLRGLLRRAQHRTEEALADLRQALEQVERLRGALQAERFRAAFLGDRLAIYEAVVAQALSQEGDGNIAEAFAAAERAKSRALLDVVGGALDLDLVAARESADPGEAAMLADLARLNAELNWLYGGLASEDGDPPTPEKTAERQRSIRETERQLDALRDRLAVGRGVSGLFADPLGLADARRLVPPGAALVEYFLAEGELLAFVLRGRSGSDEGEVSVVRRLASREELTERVRRVLFQIGRALRARTAPAARRERLLADAQRELGALHDLVLAPLAPAIGPAERLIVVPHGPLHAVPFAALWDGSSGRYVVEALEVQSVPSASLLARVSEPAGGAAEGRPLVVGVPDAFAPQIGAEATRLAAALGGRLVLGDEASAERVIGAAADAGIVHLACHGRFSAENPLASGLKLADRWLTVRDIYALRLRASLVTLSGCDTGRSVVGDGDELVGLVRGFFVAGAASLLMSLWLVNDESATDLMDRFYRSWQGGASKAAALRSAQLAAMAEHPHPAFWAPFVLVGRS